MKVTRLTRRLLRARRNRRKWWHDKFKWYERELRLAEAYAHGSRERISDLEFELRRFKAIETNHWIMVTEEDQNRVFHFEGLDAEHLAKMAFINNTMPKRVVLLAKVTEWSGDYKKAGKAIVGGEVRRKQRLYLENPCVEISTHEPKLIELK